MSSTNGGFEFYSPENTNWIFQEVKDTMWTVEENKLFEQALASIGVKDDLDNWYKIADLIPGKNVDDVIKRYKKLEDDISDIEAGLVPTPGYSYDDTTAGEYFFELENSGGGFGYDCIVGGKRSSQAMSDGFRLPMPEKERKKGVPWTEEEHRRFLMGLKKYGKGDWRNIARNFVTTRTPTQVASHAQKYFIRQLTDCKDKRRSSIHDITTVNVPDANAPIAAATVNPTPTNSCNALLPPEPHHSFAFAPASNYYNSFPQWS